MSAFSTKLLAMLLLLLVLSGVGVFLVRFRNGSSNSAVSIDPSTRISQELTAQVTRIEATEKRIAETVWAKEMLAQECGRTIESFWDSANAATNKLKLFADFPAGEIVLGKWKSPQILRHGIQSREGGEPRSVLSLDEWRRFVEELDRSAWRLAGTEFRHNRFETDEAGQPRQSDFYFSAHLTNAARADRALLEGNLIIDWAPKESSNGQAAVKRVDASHLTLKTRHGEPPFQLIFWEPITPPGNSYSIDPLILYDLDGDGFSEIILAAKNLVYRRGPGGYQPQPLCQHSPGLISTALIADFDGDGAADFLCLKHEGLFLFKGSPQGAFDQPGEMVWPAPPDLKYPMVLTCGDIDQDGDLDIFLAQYKVPYELGAMPTPYHDANDGYPAYLLMNNGQGNFTDATTPSGLGQKRWRRTYSSSLADLDGDRHLDLVVVSDFAGVDLYRNNGRGRFTEVTHQWIAEPRAFGMGHALADFNADGRLDLLMIGMTSPTAERLEHLGLWRPGAAEDRAMRSQMTFGNRLCLARPNGGFDQTPFSASIARSGWSWGCSAFDFDNDGFPDVYIANGLESRDSVRDYESEYWLHDRYVGNSREDSAAYLYFKAKFSRTRGRGQSYGGYEKNRFYLNQSGASFLEAAHLFGIGLEQDSRNVVSDDLDGDGRVDLIVTSFETWPKGKQTLRVYKNILNNPGHWIGLRFREEGEGKSPVGARVTLRFNGRSAVREIVTGDSYRSQHANTVHFGLGEIDHVDRLEIAWPNGQEITLREPAVDRYHRIHAPSRNSLRR